uniref:Gustatory receptor n=1 Tax=Tetranychus urticae TaxID=32264 RepID=T1KJF1_TETUR
MPSINMQQCFARNEKLKHYPKVSIDSIPSKFQLMISSTSNIFGKCLFVFIMLIMNFVHCRHLLHISLDSVFTVKIRGLTHFLKDNWLPIIFYLRYNHNLMRQIDDHWNRLQIDYDYETRKYFWTRKAFNRWILNVLVILSFIISYCYGFYKMYYYTDGDKLTSELNFKQNSISITIVWLFGSILYFVHFCKLCIYIDLVILAQTAVQFNLIKLKKLLNESTKDGKSLNINDIQNIRHKYLLSCRLVDKIDEIISLDLLFKFTDFVINSFDLSYTLLYTEQNRWDKCNKIIHHTIGLIYTVFYTHATLKIHDQSLESLAIVYKLSLKTNSIRLLNEISLFFNHNEIGFTFGGMFMLTTSSLSTLFSMLVTIVFASPSFVS